MTTSFKEDIVVRKDLDFGITDKDIPRYWMDGDAFKTRVIDGVQMSFPTGNGISSRAYATSKTKLQILNCSRR
jgi:predicted metal-dependent hydrolase